MTSQVSRMCILVIVVFLPLATSQPPTRPPEMLGHPDGGKPPKKGWRQQKFRPPPPQHNGPPRLKNPVPNQGGQPSAGADPHQNGLLSRDPTWIPVPIQHYGPAMPEWTPQLYRDNGPNRAGISPHPAGAPRMGGPAQRPGGPPPRGGGPQHPGGPPQQMARPPQMNAPPRIPVPWADLQDRPVIGVLTQASKLYIRDYGNDYVKKEYIKFLEMAGAYVTLIQAGHPREFYREIFSRINGLFLPGGGAQLRNSTFSETIRIFVDLAKEANDKGDHFPIWGTCLGFEIMVIQAAKMYALNETDSSNMSLPLDLSPSYKTTQMLRNAPQEIIDYLTKENTTANSHIMSLLTETYHQVEPLNKFFRIVSTNKGRDGQDFVSTIEAHKYPFFAVQWHPEKPVFLRRPDLDIPTSDHAIKIGQYFANFFISEARKSNHTFPSEEARALAVMGDDDPFCLPKIALQNICKACSCCQKGIQHSWSTDLCLIAVTCLCVALFVLYVWPTLYIFPSNKKLCNSAKCE